MVSALNTSHSHLLNRPPAQTCLFLLAGVLLLFADSLSAQVNPLRVEDAVMPREIAPGSSISFSHDSNFMAYTASRGHSGSPQANDNDTLWFVRGTDVHVVNLVTNKEENVTRGEGSNWQPVWSPERNLLAFLSDRGSGGKVHLWLWNGDARAMKMASPLEAKYGPVEWTDDGRQIVFMASIPSKTEGGLPKENLQQAGGTTVPGVRVYESAGTSAESATATPWNLDDYSAELVSIDVVSGRSRELFRGQIGTYKLSPDGLRLAVSVATRFEKAGAQQMLFDVVVVSIPAGERQAVLPDIRMGPDGSGFSWSPDSSRLCVRLKNVTTNIYTYKVVN